MGIHLDNYPSEPLGAPLSSTDYALQLFSRDSLKMPGCAMIFF